jgi:hypothetical protein
MQEIAIPTEASRLAVIMMRVKTAHFLIIEILKASRDLLGRKAMYSVGLFATCVLAGFFIDLFFYSDDGGDMFLRRFTFNRLHGAISRTQTSRQNTVYFFQLSLLEYRIVIKFIRCVFNDLGRSIDFSSSTYPQIFGRVV